MIEVLNIPIMNELFEIKIEYERLSVDNISIN